MNNNAHHNDNDGSDNDQAGTNHVSEAANNTHNNGDVQCEGCVA